jgi:hypothetical protein
MADRQGLGRWFINPAIDFEKLRRRDSDMVYAHPYDLAHPYFTGRSLSPHTLVA